MPKRSLDDNIQNGYLTVNNIASLTGYSTTMIWKWVKSDPPKVDCITIPGNSERRIAPPSLVKFLRESKLPIHEKILQAEARYNLMYRGSFQR